MSKTTPVKSDDLEYHRFDSPGAHAHDLGPGTLEKNDSIQEEYAIFDGKKTRLDASIVDPSTCTPGFMEPIRTMMTVEPGSVKGSVFSMTSGMIGPGMTIIPYTFYCTGIVFGILLLIFGAWCALISSDLLLNCSAAAEPKYESLATLAYGKRAGAFAKITVYLLTWGATCSYLVIMKTILWWDCKEKDGMTQCNSVLRNWMCPGKNDTGCAGWSAFLTDEDASVAQRNWVLLVTLLVIFPLSMFEKTSSLRFTSMVCVCCVVYIMGVVVGHFIKSGHNLSDIRWWNLDLNFFHAFPVITMSFLIHWMVLPVYSELSKPSVPRMRKVTHRTILAGSVLYNIVAVCGYLTMLDIASSVDGRNRAQSTDFQNILTAYGDMTWDVLVAKFALVLAITLSLPLSVMAGRSMMHSLLFAPIDEIDSFKHRFGISFGLTVFFVGTALLVAIFFEKGSAQLFGLTGATAASTIAYILPGVLYLKMHGGESGEATCAMKAKAVGITALGISFLVVGPISVFMPQKHEEPAAVATLAPTNSSMPW